MGRNITSVPFFFRIFAASLNNEHEVQNDITNPNDDHDDEL